MGTINILSQILLDCFNRENYLSCLNFKPLFHIEHIVNRSLFIHCESCMLKQLL